MPTAGTRYGVYNLARNIGYMSRPPSPARTTCLLTIPFDNPNRNNIAIPKYTKLSTQDGKMFYIGIRSKTTAYGVKPKRYNTAFTGKASVATTTTPKPTTSILNPFKR